MKRISITQKLSRVYTRLFGIFFLTSVLVAGLTMAVIINRNIIETQVQMTRNISQAVEGYFADMNEFSMSLMNSEDFKEAVITQLPQALKDGTSQNEAILTIYSIAYQMFEKGYRVGVATRDGVYIWLADRIIVAPVQGHVPLYDSYDGYGKPAVYALEQNDYLTRIAGGAGSVYINDGTIVLSRSINRRNHFIAPQAMLEVHVGRGDFDRFVGKLLGDTNTEHLRLSITTARGNVLYGDGVVPDVPANTWVRSDGDMVLIQTAFSNRLTLCYTIPVSTYYQRLILFITVSLAFSAGMLLLIILVTYRVSKSLTHPIAAMSGQLKNLDLSGDVAFQKVDTELYELDVMAQTVATLHQKLLDTLQDMVAAQTAEVQSQLMALQSQMQPHFLYNTLAVISSLSEQGNPEAVSRMCNNLSKMLRYVSAEEGDGVTIYEEVCFLNSYVAIMKERFPCSRVQIDIPMELMSCKVPKLVLQPLCENAYKYSGRPDTEIRLTGTQSGTNWRVRVRDNGAGFAPEKIDEIMEHCQAVRKNGSALSTSIGGMGLVNIYARLAFFYGEDFVFEIDPTQGISIGGGGA